MSSPEPTDKAESEAAGLIAAVRALHAGKTDTASKAEEAQKLINEVGKLHALAERKPVSATSAGPPPEQHTRLLAERIMRLETDQKIAREQINHLHHARAEFELSRLRRRDQETAAQQASNAELEQQLGGLIKQKENEYLSLVQEVEAVRLQSERETSLLEAQRDAARATVEQQRRSLAGEVSLNRYKRISRTALLIMVFVLGLLLGLLGVFVKFVVIDKQPFPGIAADAPGEAQPPPAAAETQGKITEGTGQPETPPPPPVPRGEYRDPLAGGGEGPLMIKLPAGRYTVGSPANLPYPDEHPPYEAGLRNFSIAKYETTFAEYQRFAEATGRSLPNDSGFGGAQQPVINVTWEDATAYTHWLSSETGQQYRLPSEREWEYAASAGARSAYWWGDETEKGRAVCAQCGTRWDGQQPAPVGSLPANSLGLHEILGNVMEWTVECRHLNYAGAPAQGQVWEGGDCTKRMVRGGSYRTYPKELRLTRRSAYPPKAYSDEIGFRVVRVD